MTQSEDFAKAIAFNWWPFLGIFKMLSFFEYKLLFGDDFCIEQLQCVVATFLACFFAFLIFDPKLGFCNGYSLCLVAIFGNFQNTLIFRILAVFGSRFLHRTTAMCCRNLVSTFFFPFFVFDPRWGFCKGYSLCLVAIFGNYRWIDR